MKISKTKLIGGVFAALLGTWALIFVINTSLDTKVGFDYDDTLCFSTPSFRAAAELYTMAGLKKGNKNYEKFWTEVNSRPERDIRKPVTISLVQLVRLLGIDPVLVTARPGISSERFVQYWSPYFKEVHFTKEKANVFKNARFLAFFGDSDSDMEEARKASVLGIRIKRNPASSYTRNYNPGKYGELIVPFSEGPSR